MVNDYSGSLIDMAKHLIEPYLANRCLVYMGEDRNKVLCNFEGLDRISCDRVDHIAIYQVKIVIKTNLKKLVLMVGFSDPELERAIKDNDYNSLMWKMRSQIERNVKILDKTPLSDTLYSV